MFIMVLILEAQKNSHGIFNSLDCIEGQRRRLERRLPCLPLPPGPQQDLCNRRWSLASNGQLACNGPVLLEAGPFLCKHCQDWNRLRLVLGSAWWPDCWSGPIWIEEMRKATDVFFWKTKHFLTCQTACTGNEWTKGGGGPLCWMDLASIAAYSASQHFRSHHFDIRNEPAQPSLEFKSFLNTVLRKGKWTICLQCKKAFSIGS